MAKTPIGIVGFGKIAHDQHAPAIAGSGAFELVAACNGSDLPVGVKGFASYQDMLRGAPEIEAVAICTPPGPRRRIAVDCLKAGKHVLLEKPPAGSVTEVSDIASAAKAAGRVAFATYHAQHNAAVKRAADLLAGKTVSRLQVDWKEDVRQWHPGQEWVFEPGGFGVFDPGINALSILVRIMPAPVFIEKAELFFPQGRQGPIAANLDFGTGGDHDEALHGVFDWRQTGPQTWTIAVETVEGPKLTLSDGGARLQQPGQPDCVGPPDEYPDVYREFADLLARGQSKVEAEPYQLVADAFMLGARTEVEPFSF
jgi:D-galactose 1-dehydrogenase